MLMHVLWYVVLGASKRCGKKGVNGQHSAEVVARA